MTDKAADLGFVVYVHDCAGYKRLTAFPMGERVGDAPYAVVETTDCTLPEARARMIAKLGGSK